MIYLSLYLLFLWETSDNYYLWHAVILYAVICCYINNSIISFNTKQDWRNLSCLLNVKEGTTPEVNSLQVWQNHCNQWIIDIAYYLVEIIHFHEFIQYHDVNHELDWKVKDELNRLCFLMTWQWSKQIKRRTQLLSITIVPGQMSNTYVNILKNIVSIWWEALFFTLSSYILFLYEKDSLGRLLLPY